MGPGEIFLLLILPRKVIYREESIFRRTKLIVKDNVV